MRCSLIVRLALLAVAAAVLGSCGGHSSSTPVTPKTISVSPTSFSLQHGDVVQLSSIQVLDSNNNVISPTPTSTFSSSNTSVVTVSSAGLICAGVFDASNVVCQTKDSNGNLLADGAANVIVTSDGLTATVPVFVHAHVNNISVSGPTNPPVCASQNQTEQFTAKAFSGGNDITSTVGPFTWRTGSAVIATVDANGIATSKSPGATTVVAAVGNATGTPALFLACPPKNISLVVTGGTQTSFNVATGTAQSVTATVTDILGQPIAGIPLTFGSFTSTAAAVSAGGAITTPGAGVSTIVASCTPPTCNAAAGPEVNFNGTGVGLAVYSNPVAATVTGTTSTSVYVTGPTNPDGSANTSLIPIDVTANTAGTAITLPFAANSMVFNNAGTKAFLGSAGGLIELDPTATTPVTASVSSVTGKVLAVSPDSVKVIVSDVSLSKVFVFDTSANTQENFDEPNVNFASFDGDSSKAYLTNGTSVFVYSPKAGLRTLSQAGDGAAFTPQEAVAYIGGAAITALAACNDNKVDTAVGAVNLLAPTPDGTHMIGLGTAGWIDLKYMVDNSNGCPPTASNTEVTAALQPFVTAPSQIVVAPDDSNAYVTGYTSNTPPATSIPFYHLADGTTGAVTLSGAGGPILAGSITPDGHSLYVGVGANGGAGPQVHRIDLTPATGPADATQVNVNFNPTVVVVRPK